MNEYEHAKAQLHWCHASDDPHAEPHIKRSLDNSLSAGRGSFRFVGPRVRAAGRSERRGRWGPAPATRAEKNRLQERDPAAVGQKLLRVPRSRQKRKRLAL